jgi:hypothetical protein
VDEEIMGIMRVFMGPESEFEENLGECEQWGLEQKKGAKIGECQQLPGLKSTSPRLVQVSGAQVTPK